MMKTEKEQSFKALLLFGFHPLTFNHQPLTLRLSAASAVARSTIRSATAKPTSRAHGVRRLRYVASDSSIVQTTE